MSRLFLVRHGTSEANSAGEFAGHSDVEMTATGYQQVERLRDRLAGEKIDAVYSSDLKRALLTAEIISSGRKLNLVPCPELREMNYGDVEGLTFDEISRLYPEVAELCVNFAPRLKFPGGEGFTEFAQRVSSFLVRLEKHALSDRILIVAHGGPVRVLVCYLLGLDPVWWWQMRCANASLTIVETSPQRAVLSLLNDTCHLAADSGG